MNEKRRIVIKIGSNVLTRKDGLLDMASLSSIVDQVATLNKSGMDILLVSSGAVASGRCEIHINEKMDQVSARQLFSAVGQAKLLQNYYNLFRNYGIICGQVLTTKESLSTRSHYLNQRNCLETMLENHVIPIINENDAISVTELMFTDNDELSGLIASMMNADMLLILSNVDGIFAGNPRNGAPIIDKVCAGKGVESDFIQAGSSSFGRGGMLTKSRIASKVAEEGCDVVIANGRTPDIITDIVLEGPEKVRCTHFIPSEKISGVKKWIAHSEDFAKGEIHIDEGTLEALAAAKAVSLLPVGVKGIIGDFEAGDIVRIMGPDGRQIGVGKAMYGSAAARKAMGQKGQKPLIHYDYLYLD
jgi:glutamate 5-kinase